MSPTVKSAVLRAIRTFIQAFLGVWGIPQLLAWISGNAPLDVSALRAAAAAGIAALVAFLWRQFLDPSSVPSLQDTPAQVVVEKQIVVERPPTVPAPIQVMRPETPKGKGRTKP